MTDNRPIDFEAQRPSWLESAWLGIKRLLADRNRREAPIVRARERKEGGK